MKINKRLRKAFTLVELVVVIAIIAILSTVSVVTYFGITNSAKKSVDDTLIAELNKCLQLDETINGKPNTSSEALEVVEENGFTVEKMTPTQDKKEIVWHQTTNKFELVDEIKVQSRIKNAEGTTNISTWRFLSEYTSNGGYSIYLKDADFSGEALTLNITTGLDVGKNTEDFNITYESTSCNEVTIRTNGGTLTTNAETDTIYHYGSASKVNVTSNIFQEFGEVSGNIEIAKGNVEVKASAKVNSVLVTGNDVKIDLKDSQETKILVSESVDVDHQPEVSGKDFNSEENKVTIVNTFDQLKNALTNGGKIALGDDIKANSSSRYQLKVPGDIDATLELNGHTIIGCTAVASFGIKGRLTINGDGKILSTSQLYSLFYVYEYSEKRGELIINGGNFELLNTNTGSNASIVPLIKIGDSSYNPAKDTDYKGGIVTINGGKFTSREFCIDVLAEGELTINNGIFTALNNAVIATDGNKGMGNNKITINGGTFNGKIIDSGYIACGIYLANNDTLIVNGGTFNIYNGCGILVRSGNATIEKDVVINLNNDGSIVEGKVGDSSVKISTAVAIVKDEKANYPGGEPQVTNNSSYEVYDNSASN